MDKTNEVVDISRSAEALSTAEGEVIDVNAEKHQHADVALDFVQQHGETTYTAEEEKVVLRKIDWRLMPLVCFVAEVTRFPGSLFKDVHILHDCLHGQIYPRTSGYLRLEPRPPPRWTRLLMVQLFILLWISDLPTCRRLDLDILPRGKICCGDICLLGCNSLHYSRRPELRWDGSYESAFRYR